MRPTAEGSRLHLLHPRPVQHCNEVARLGHLAVVTECLAVVTECLAVVTECLAVVTECLAVVTESPVCQCLCL